MCFTWFKKHIIFHILYIIVAPLCPAFLKHADFYKAHRSEKWGVLWLASYPVRWLAKYLKRETEMLRPHRIVMAFPARWHKNNKTHYKRGMCCIQWGLILSFYMSHCIAPRKHYHVCVCDRRKDKQQALLYTAQNSRLNRQKQKRTYRLWVRSLCASLQARQLSCQVQEIVLRKLCRTHSNICVELFWNSVVNTT